MAIEVDQSTEAARVAREYFEALGRADSQAPRRFYAPGGRGQIHGVVGPVDADGASAFFDEVFAAFPDWRFEILDLIAEGERAAGRWRARGRSRARAASWASSPPAGARTSRARTWSGCVLGGSSASRRT